MHHRAKFCTDRSNRWQDMAVFIFFQNGGHAPSLICCTPTWDYLRRVVGSVYRCAKFG